MPYPPPDGYLATPSNDTGSGVPVLHAWWGLNDTIKALCDQKADVGFMAFALDLYQGQVTDSIDRAETLAQGVFGNLERTREQVLEAASFLGQRASQSERGLAFLEYSFTR